MPLTDDWPERIALPRLRQQVNEIDFLIECLSDQPRQKQARGKLIEARHRIKAAIVALEVQ